MLASCSSGDLQSRYQFPSAPIRDGRASRVLGRLAHTRTTTNYLSAMAQPSRTRVNTFIGYQACGDVEHIRSLQSHLPINLPSPYVPWIGRFPRHTADVKRLRCGQHAPGRAGWFTTGVQLLATAKPDTYVHNKRSRRMPRPPARTDGLHTRHGQGGFETKMRREGQRTRPPKPPTRGKSKHSFYSIIVQR